MIDTQALRKRIYDMAISGQLTHRLLDDTPVDSSLLSYQEEGVEALPEIPVKWKYCYFDDVLINRDSERIPVSVADRKKLSKIFDYYGASGVIDKVDNYLFDENLLLIGEDGANLLSRSTPIAFIAKGKYWVNNHAHVLQATEHVLLEYIEIYINAISLVPYVTGSAQPKLSQHMMSKIPVPVPPIEEQQRIVEIVRTVIDHIDFIDTLQSQYQDNLATLKSKIIDAGIQGKLTEQLPEDGTAEELYQQIQQEKLALEKAGKIKKSKPLPPISDEEKPFDIPENWKWVKLGNVITLASGTDFKPEDYNDAGIGMPYMTGASNIENDKLIINRWTPCPRNIAREGELLLVCKGSGFGKLVICNVSETHIARQFMSIRPYSGVDVNYVKALMTNSFQIIKEAGKGLIPGVDRDTVLNIPLPLPPLAEQKRIVAKLEELLPLCEG